MRGLAVWISSQALGLVARSCVHALARRHQEGGGRQGGREVRARRRHVLVHQMEGELGGLVDLALEVGGVLDARHLQQDAVVALAHDGGLDGAGLVDPAAQDLDRLVDHFLLLLEQLLVRIGEPDHIAAAGHDERGIDGCGSPRCALARCASSRRVTTRPRPDSTVTSLNADLLLAQFAAHRVAEVGEALVQHRAQVGLEQEVGAAAQVEAEIDAALLVPVRQVVEQRRPAGRWAGRTARPAP